MSTKKSVVLVVAVMGAVLLGASSSWAIAPSQEEFVYFYDAYLGDCDATLSLCEMVDVNVRAKLFYFDDGDPRQYTEKYRLFGGIYECGNPDNMLEYLPLSYTWTYDFVADEDMFTGLFGLVILPGYGPVFMDVGRIVVVFATGEIVFEASEHDWWNGELDGLCEVFMDRQ